MEIKTKYNIGESVVYFDNGERHASKIVNILTSTFCNLVGQTQTNEIYTLESGYLFTVINGETKWR